MENRKDKIVQSVLERVDPELARDIYLLLSAPHLRVGLLAGLKDKISDGVSKEGPEEEEN